MSLQTPAKSRDFSIYSLILVNLITIFFAVTQGWQLSTIMAIYWCQSVTIGLVNFFRIYSLKEGEFFSEGFSINGRPAEPNKFTKNYTAFFFLLHYGFFHLVYLLFLINGTSGENHIDTVQVGEWYLILPTALMFFVNHLFSYLYNRERDVVKINIGSVMFYPYLRIIPMHLTIILGTLYGAKILTLFLVLKMFADVVMHKVEHKIFRKHI